MERRVLGRTGLEVSCIGMGGMGFMDGRTVERSSAVRIIKTALDEGIDFFDTARIYFESEDVFGEALRDERRPFRIASKTYRRSARGAYREVLSSLRHLRMKYIDVYQLHHVQHEYELDDVLAPDGAYYGLLRARQEGKIGFIGISSHHANVLVKAIETDRFDTVQFPFNPTERHDFEPVLRAAQQRNVGTIIMKPLGGGAIREVQPVLRWILAEGVSTIIPGCSSVEHVRLDAAVGHEVREVTEEERARLLADVERLDSQYCRRCRYCETVCAAELPIADIFRSESYLVLSATYARDEYRRLGRSPEECVQCGKCERICPYGLPVRKNLVRARERLERGKLEDWIVTLTHKLHIYDIARRAYFKLGGRVPKR
jgi:hypothetical protein